MTFYLIYAANNLNDDNDNENLNCDIDDNDVYKIIFS